MKAWEATRAGMGARSHCAADSRASAADAVAVIPLRTGADVSALLSGESQPEAACRPAVAKSAILAGASHPEALGRRQKADRRRSILLAALRPAVVPIPSWSPNQRSD